MVLLEETSSAAAFALAAMTLASAAQVVARSAAARELHVPRPKQLSARTKPL